MPKPRLKGGGFVQFYPAQLGNQFKFIHKLRHGVIDLQMRGMGKRLDEVRQVFGNSLGPGVPITKATQSAVIRMEVPQLIREEDFDMQKTKVIECLTVATDLADWLRGHDSMTPKTWPA